MAISGNLQYTGAIQLGETHQHTTGGIVDIWGVVTSDMTETATSVTINMNGAMFYNGYDNCVIWEVGVYKVPENSTAMNDFNAGEAYVQGNWLRTSPMWTGGSIGSGDWNWWWMQESSFTFNKTTSRFGLMPYMKIGCLNRWGSQGDSGSGNYWMYGNEYGLLCMQSVTRDEYYPFANGMTYGGKTLDCFILLGGSSNSYTWSYANCAKKVDPLSTVFVNSGGTYKRATNLYVYDSTGKPRRAKSITVYDSSGKPRTKQL